MAAAPPDLVRVGLLGCLTAVVMATSADRCCTKWRFVAVVGSGGGVAEGVAEEVDGVALEAEADVGVHGGGDADVVALN